MGDIVLLDADGRARRLDLAPPEADGCGWRNVLPGYHELAVAGDGVWHHAGFILGAATVAALRLEGERLIDARAATLPLREQLVDVLVRDVGGARAWQRATSALDRQLDVVAVDGQLDVVAVDRQLGGVAVAVAVDRRLDGVAIGRQLDRASVDRDPLTALQAAFVRSTLHDDPDATARLRALVAELVQQAARWESAAEMGRTLAAMIALDAALVAKLPIAELIGALSDAGNDSGDGDRLAAASALQLAVCA